MADHPKGWVKPPTIEDIEAEMDPELVQRLTRGGTKWSLERWAEACRASFLGMCEVDASKRAGIGRTTLRRWYDVEPALKTHLDAWRSAGGENLLSLVHGFAEEDPQSARWLLERTLRESMAPPTKRTEISGPDDTAIRVELHDADAGPDDVPVPPDISGESDDSEG